MKILAAVLFLLLSAATAQARVELTGDVIYQVNTSSGTDAPTCLDSGPCKTPGYALRLMQTTRDLAGFFVLMECTCADTAGVSISGPFVGQGANDSVILRGISGATITAPSGYHAIEFFGGARIRIEDIGLSASGGGSCLYADDSGTIVHHSGLDFGVCSIQQFSHVGARVLAVGNYSISGNATYHAGAAGTGADLQIAPGVTVTLIGSRAFGVFLLAAEGALINTGSVSFSGSATGIKCSANFNAVIHTGGALASLPGNSACTTVAGGQLG